MMPPTIHPLSSTPLGRDPNGECLCNWCRHWHPLIENIRLQLDDHGKELLNEYATYVETRIEDGNVDAAKLNGDWPGWEALKGFKPTYRDDSNEETP